jgi:hypothetical protein
MGHTKKNWDEQQKKKALSMLKSIEQKIKNNELIVEEYGFWEATRGKWNFRVVAKESEDFEGYEQFS